MKKRISFAFFTLCLFVSLLPVTASAAGNPFPMHYTWEGTEIANCTYVAWQQAYDRLGIELPMRGNAKGWLDEAQGKYATGSTPQADSIVVYGGGVYGHVAYVTNVSGDRITVIENGNWNGSYSSSLKTRESSGATGTYYGDSSLIGYIYLRSSTPNNPIGSYVSVPYDSYVIQSALDEGKAIDIDNASTERGANARLYAMNGTGAQSFQITGNGNGYRIIATCSGLSLDVMSGSRDDGANIWQYDANDTDSQRWRFVDAGDGYVYIESALGTYIDADNAGTSNGTNIQSYSFNGTDAQKWKLIKASAVVGVSSVSLSETALTLNTGESASITATVSPSDATVKSIEWSSSDTSVASVSGGRITAKGVGTATITAVVGDRSATCSVTVTNAPVPVASVTLNSSAISLAVGESGTLTASVNPSNAADKAVTWSSSDTGVVTVSGGKVTAIKAGTATITAKVGDKTASCSVTVKAKAVAVESITMSRTDISLTVGDHATLSASVLPSNATNSIVTWSSSDTGIATVSNGQVSAVAVGTATITASAGGKSAACRVVVAEKEKKASPSDVHFEKQTIYYQDQFTDVPANQWYTPSVASAFELGLMKGNGDSTFNPYGDVTVAEAVTMAARIHSIYTTGAESFEQTGSKWYQVYLDYALENGIISRAYYNSAVTHKATRAQFAEIFAAALPSEALGAINSVADNAIPDVSISDSFAASVYKLYRAGILTGSDANGTFNPTTYITRAEAAAIVSRMAESDNRVSITLN